MPRAWAVSSGTHRVSAPTTAFAAVQGPVAREMYQGSKKLTDAQAGRSPAAASVATTVPSTPSAGISRVTGTVTVPDKVCPNVSVAARRTQV